MISSAWAQEATTAAATTATEAMQQPGLMANIAPLILIMVVFYFLLIRPQQKRLKEHQSMIDSIKRGDKVVTSGGIIGRVMKVEDDANVLVEIAPDVSVKVVRSTISTVLGRIDPADVANDSAPVESKKKTKK